VRAAPSARAAAQAAGASVAIRLDALFGQSAGEAAVGRGGGGAVGAADRRAHWPDFVRFDGHTRSRLRTSRVGTTPREQLALDARFRSLSRWVGTSDLGLAIAVTRQTRIQGLEQPVDDAALDDGSWEPLALARAAEGREGREGRLGRPSLRCAAARHIQHSFRTSRHGAPADGRAGVRAGLARNMLDQLHLSPTAARRLARAPSGPSASARALLASAAAAAPHSPSPPYAAPARFSPGRGGSPSPGARAEAEPTRGNLRSPRASPPHPLDALIRDALGAAARRRELATRPLVDAAAAAMTAAVEAATKASTARTPFERLRRQLGVSPLAADAGPIAAAPRLRFDLGMVKLAHSTALAATDPIAWLERVVHLPPATGAVSSLSVLPTHHRSPAPAPEHALNPPGATDSAALRADGAWRGGLPLQLQAAVGIVDGTPTTERRRHLSTDQFERLEARVHALESRSGNALDTSSQGW
jgi:phage FluMu protein gp41